MLFDGLANLIRGNAEQIFLAIATVLGVAALFNRGALTKVATLLAGLFIAGIVVFAPEVVRGVANAVANTLPQ